MVFRTFWNVRTFSKLLKFNRFEKYGPKNNYACHEPRQTSVNCMIDFIRKIFPRELHPKPISCCRNPIRSDLHKFTISNAVRKYMNSPEAFVGKGKFRPNWIILAGGILSFLGLKEEKEEDELVHVIKLAVLSIQKGELDKAEQILHLALRIAYEKMETQGITYIYDMLANVAYQKQDYKKAEKLFIETIRRLLEAGKPNSDNAIVEISVKLAKIYSIFGDVNKAEDGFLFCIKTMQSKLDQNVPLDKDTHLLRAMASEMYAHHLLQNSHLAKSKTYYEGALAISREHNGDKHPQTLVLLNDLGGVCSLLHEYEEATDLLKEAIRIGSEINSEDLPAFYCNLGAVYFKVGNFDEAETMCKRGHLLATKLGNKEAEKDALGCLDDIKKKKVEAKP